MLTRFNSPFRSEVPPQWRGACAAVAGGGPNRATAIVVARLVFTISGQSRAFTALRLIDLVTATHSHLNELATLEFGLQQLARLEDELPPDGAVPGPLMLALSSRTRHWHRRAGADDCRCNAAGRGAAAAHDHAGRDHDRLPPTRRTMAAALSGRLAGVTSSTPASLLMSTLRIRMIGVSGLTSSWCRCATTGRPRASCRASA